MIILKLTRLMDGTELCAGAAFFRTARFAFEKEAGA